MASTQLHSLRVVGLALLPIVALLAGTLMDQCDARPALPRPVVRPTLAFGVARRAKTLVGRQFDLDLCKNVVLKLTGKRINKKRCRLSAHDAVQLAPMLEQENLHDRTYVWCRMASLYQSLSGNMTKFDVRQLDKFQGDIEVCRDDVDLVLAPFFPTERERIEAYDNARNYHMATSRRRAKRKIIPFSSHHWKRAVIPYKIKDPNLNPLTVASIKEAIKVWEKDTCIRFYETDKIFFQPHIHFRKGPGCSSRIGRRPNGQLVSIGDGCESVGIISHEIGHVLGFYHEQSRPDRDLYVEIMKDNIVVDIEQFAKLSWDSGMTMGIPYDYSSVMHYGNLDFSVDGELFTMMAKEPEMQRVMGQRQAPSFLDFKMANWNYCSASCKGTTLEWDACENGGYRNPNDCETCLCPPGLAGTKCERPEPGKNVDCGKQMLYATYEDQELTTPGYHTEDGFASDAYCSWLIRASTAGKRVRLQFVENFYFTEDPSLCEDFVEVRYKNVAKTGPRLCGEDPPGTVFLSHGSQVLVAANSLQVGWWQGFKIVYKEENCGGCSVDAAQSETFCIRTAEFDCSPESNCTGSGCPPPRRNVCYREEEYCCDGYLRFEDRCIRDVGDFSSSTYSSPEARISTTTTAPKTTTPAMTTLSTTQTTLSKTAAHTQSTTSTTEQTTSAVTTTQSKPTSTTTTTTTTEKPTVQIKTTQFFTTTTTKSYEPTETTNSLLEVHEGTWTDWRQWSPCSASCGMCGRRSRTRTCLDGPCRGKPEQWQYCGDGLCPPVTREKKYKCMTTKPNCSSGGWYLAVKSSCKVEEVCTLLETTEPCCIGRPARGQCHR